MNCLLELNNISKNYGNIQVLKGVSLTLNKGEVHFLAGENGAGKSTLMKILAGKIHASSGEIKTFKNKVSICHQELSCLDNLTVLENFFLGREETKFSFVLNKKQKNRIVPWLDLVGLKLTGNELAKDLSISEKYLFEIAKALSFDSEILILDEPTAGLPEEEAKRIYKIIEKLKASGKGIFYISHKMHEMLLLSDRITVLRDGEAITTIDKKDYNEDNFIMALVGRKLGDYFPKRETSFGPVAIEIPELGTSLQQGEILGVAGLEGAGHSKIFEKIFENPMSSIQNGVAFVTNDRKNTGLILNHSIEENICLPIYKKESHFGFLDEKKCLETSNKLISELSIKCQGPDSEVNLLSGGNQQKVVLAKWFSTLPKVLILDEPTRGIDIGAKKEIYQMLSEFTKGGGAVLLYSSEMNELIGLSDRIITLHQSHVQNIYVRGEVGLQEKIMSDIIGVRNAKRVSVKQNENEVLSGLVSHSESDDCASAHSHLGHFV